MCLHVYLDFNQNIMRLFYKMKSYLQKVQILSLFINKTGRYQKNKNVLYNKCQIAKAQTALHNVEHLTLVCVKKCASLCFRTKLKKCRFSKAKTKKLNDDQPTQRFLPTN